MNLKYASHRNGTGAEVFGKCRAELHLQRAGKEPTSRPGIAKRS